MPSTSEVGHDKNVANFADSRCAKFATLSNDRI